MAAFLKSGAERIAEMTATECRSCGYHLRHICGIDPTDCNDGNGNKLFYRTHRFRAVSVSRVFGSGLKNRTESYIVRPCRFRS